KKRNFRLLWPLLTSVCSALSSDNGYSSRSVPYRSPWVPHVSFPPSICRIYCTWFRVAIGLYLGAQTYPHIQPFLCDFCPSDQRFARGLVGSPHPASFRSHLTMGTLAFGYILPATRRIWDLHP